MNDEFMKSEKIILNVLIYRFGYESTSDSIAGGLVVYMQYPHTIYTICVLKTFQVYPRIRNITYTEQDIFICLCLKRFITPI